MNEVEMSQNEHVMIESRKTFAVQQKPFAVRVQYYEKKIRLISLHLVINEKFVHPVPLQEFADHFTKDIVLKSDMPLMDNMYKSRPIQFNIQVLQQQQHQSQIDCWFSTFYEIAYEKKTLMLRFLMSGLNGKMNQKRIMVDTHNGSKVIPNSSISRVFVIRYVKSQYCEQPSSKNHSSKNHRHSSKNHYQSTTYYSYYVQQNYQYQQKDCFDFDFNLHQFQ